MNLIPAMDLLNGQCVRLFQGRLDKQDYFPYDPVEWALTSEKAGVKRLHMIDLGGAFCGKPQHEAILKAVRNAVSIPIQIGGGIRTKKQVDKLIELGFDVILGTLLITNPELCKELVEAYPERLIASLDCKNGEVMTCGWTQGGGKFAVDMARLCLEMGFKTLVFTDISKDGTMSGANIEALKQLLTLKDDYDFTLIASGGIGSLGDLQALKDNAIDGAILGRSLFEGAFTLESATALMAANENI